MEKQKCLIIIPGIPYPPIDGHKLKINKLVMILSKRFDLESVIITNEVIKSDQINFLKNNTAKYKIFKKSKLKFFLNLISKVFNNKPFQVNYYTFNDVKRYFLKKNDKYDYIFYNLIRTCDYFDCFNYPTNNIVDMVDLISLNYRRSKEKTKSLFFRIIYSIESKRLEVFEKEILSKAEKVLLVNKTEAALLSEDTSKVLWLPNGVKEEIFSYSKKGGLDKSICFLGAMFYQPNIDAVRWFCEEVLPKLSRDITFYIVGNKPTKQVFALERKNVNVKVTGFVEDPYMYLGSCLCFVAPLWTGGGIQNKLLEAMGLGCIVLTTSLGANPIVGARHNYNIIVCDSAEDFAKFINDLSMNPDSYSQIGLNARTLIEEYYTWEKYQRKLDIIL